MQAMNELEIAQWLSSTMSEQIDSMNCYSENGGNYVFRVTTSGGQTSYYRLMPYEEEKWQVFSLLKEAGCSQLMTVHKVVVSSRMLVIKEGSCEGAALDIGLRPLFSQPLLLERFYLELATLILELESLYRHCGLLHLDIKPEHLLVSPKGQLRLIDFGAAYVNTARLNLKRFAQQGSGPFVCRSRQLDFNGIGPHADLFALVLSLQKAFAPAEANFQLQPLADYLNGFVRSKAYLYAEVRQALLAIFMNQYGHITNR